MSFSYQQLDDKSLLLLLDQHRKHLAHLEGEIVGDASREDVTGLASEMREIQLQIESVSRELQQRGYVESDSNKIRSYLKIMSPYGIVFAVQMKGG